MQKDVLKKKEENNKKTGGTGTGQPPKDLGTTLATPFQGRA